MSPFFNYLEIVRVLSEKETISENIVGLEGVIMTGGSTYEDDTIWGGYMKRKKSTC